MAKKQEPSKNKNSEMHSINLDEEFAKLGITKLSKKQNPPQPDIPEIDLDEELKRIRMPLKQKSKNEAVSSQKNTAKNQQQNIAETKSQNEQKESVKTKQIPPIINLDEHFAKLGIPTPRKNEKEITDLKQYKNAQSIEKTQEENKHEENKQEALQKRTPNKYLEKTDKKTSAQNKQTHTQDKQEIEPKIQKRIQDKVKKAEQKEPEKPDLTKKINASTPDFQEPAAKKEVNTEYKSDTTKRYQESEPLELKRYQNTEQQHKPLETKDTPPIVEPEHKQKERNIHLRANPKKVIDLLIKKIEKEGLSRSENDFSKIMNLLLTKDPVYEQDNKYKLSRPEKSLKWR